MIREFLNSQVSRLDPLYLNIEPHVVAMNLFQRVAQTDLNMLDAHTSSYKLVLKLIILRTTM